MRKKRGGEAVPVDLTFDVLKDKQRRLRDGFPSDVGLRVHRAISWIRGAERAAGDHDADTAFICYWVAFNAAYAQGKDLHGRFQDTEFRQWYFDMILRVDGERIIYDAIWQRFSGALRPFLDNRYVFEPFWRHQHGEEGLEDWQERFRTEQHNVNQALGRQDTSRILGILFRRLYVLRNQLIHGGATWGGAVNRQQVEGGKEIMGCLVPHFVNLMMDHPGEAWGVPPYPPVDV